MSLFEIQKNHFILIITFECETNHSSKTYNMNIFILYYFVTKNNKIVRPMLGIRDFRIKMKTLFEPISVVEV